MVSEAKGDIYYGMHFYSGLAQYQEEGQEPYRVFLNEDTIRSMDPSFAGRPIFVYHVDEIETDVNELRKEADGWVVESFYNAADGKHWVKFIVVSDKANAAIARGMRLSNCYVPKTFGPGGTWNGIHYNREITAGEYEHLAIVPNPRYEESVIMTPDEFKKYNEDKTIELKKLSNTKSQGVAPMKFSFFKRAKVENSADLETMMVELPKSKREISLAALINAADEDEGKEPKMAHPDHHVQIGDKKMKVHELMDCYKDACDSLAAMKKDAGDGEDEEMEEKEEKKKEMKDDSEDQGDGEDEDLEFVRSYKRHAKKAVPMSEDDKAGEKSSLKLEKEEEKEVKDAKKKNDLEKANRLRNANKNFGFQEQKVVLSEDMVARGKSLYGSN